MSGAGVPPLRRLSCQSLPAPALSVTAMGGARLPALTTTTATVVLQHRGCLSSSQPPPPPDVQFPTTPLVIAYHQASGHHPLLMPTARFLAFAQSTAPCGSALMKPFHPTGRMIVTGETHGVPISSARQEGTPLSFLTLSLTVNRLPSSWTSRPVGLLALLFIQISAADV